MTEELTEDYEIVLSPSCFLVLLDFRTGCWKEHSAKPLRGRGSKMFRIWKSLWIFFFFFFHFSKFLGLFFSKKIYCTFYWQKCFRVKEYSETNQGDNSINSCSCNNRCHTRLKFLPCNVMGSSLLVHDLYKCVATKHRILVGLVCCFYVVNSKELNPILLSFAQSRKRAHREIVYGCRPQPPAGSCSLS